MNEFRLVFAVFLLSVIAITEVEGENEPDLLALLRKAHNPPVAYTCKIAVSSWGSPKGDTALLREYRLPDGRYRIEYLSPPKLKGIVIISDGKKRWRVAKGKVIWELEVNGLTSANLELLSKNYRLTVLGSTEVLGRKAWKIEIVPKVKGKFHHKFWLDSEHGIILKGVVSDEKGVPIALMTVSELEFLEPNKVKDGLFSAPKKQKTNSPKQMTKIQAQSKWSIKLPDNLPFGFVLEKIEELELPKDSSALHALYTDGLMRISLFALPSDIKPSLGSSRVAIVRKKMGEKFLLIMGNINKRLLERIANEF
ncbi:MAG: hypothetical protein NZ805_05385 [Armatimonadetes bacterium]|nr:hypothetical protein [Armatimonadota bacterium]MDW8028033.1 sigma-E factor regulatory protein RseB domain-containing protein [Armatimonadota bacterium]